MLLLVTIPTDGVIIEAGIFYQSDPFAPPRWDVAAVVFIQVLAKEGWRMRGKTKALLTWKQFLLYFLSLFKLYLFLIFSSSHSHRWGWKPACPIESARAEQRSRLKTTGRAVAQGSPPGSSVQWLRDIHTDSVWWDVTASSPYLHFSHQPVWQAGAVQHATKISIIERRKDSLVAKITTKDQWKGLICWMISNTIWHFYPPTCPVAGVVEIDGKRTRFVLSLPGRRGAVLVVGVSVVVVDVLARQHGGPWRAAHGCGDKSVGERCASVFHYFAGFIHDL